MADDTKTTLLGLTHTRRRVLRRAVGGIGTAALAAGGGLTVRNVLASDEDDDDDRDSSGSGSGGDHDDHDDDDDEAVEVTGDIPAGSIEIRIVSEDADGFQPNDLTVDLGQSVTFVNAHDDEHTATGSGFDTGEIDRGETATIVLDEPGRYAYACRFHPEMTGAISVRDEDGNVPEPSAQNQEAPPAAIEVQIVNFAFEPASVTVPAGGTVVWINNDSAPHTATGLGAEFDSGILDPGASFSWQFTEPGTVSYECGLHSAMQGTIEVGGDAAVGNDEVGASPEPNATIVGAWAVSLEPDADAGLAMQRGLVTFHGDGTLDATFAPVAGAADGLGFRLSEAHGSWQDAGEGGFSATIAALLLDDGHQFAGMLTIAEEGQLAADGASYAGTAAFEATDADGGGLASGGGTTEGRRIGSPDADDTGTVELDATPVAESAGTASTTVTIVDFAFDPAEIEVAAGSTVTWVNEDAAPHTATADDGSFNTGRLDQGGDGAVTFDQLGTFPYHCDFHPNMVGTVIVS